LATPSLPTNHIPYIPTGAVGNPFLAPKELPKPVVDNSNPFRSSTVPGVGPTFAPTSTMFQGRKLANDPLNNLSADLFANLQCACLRCWESRSCMCTCGGFRSSSASTLAMLSRTIVELPSVGTFQVHAGGLCLG
jgi:hypothetical protein